MEVSCIDHAGVSVSIDVGNFAAIVAGVAAMADDCVDVRVDQVVRVFGVGEADEVG